jgi:hypothetical protein
VISGVIVRVTAKYIEHHSSIEFLQGVFR